MFNEDEKKKQDSLDAFFSHFTKPQINPLELFILSIIVEKSNQNGIFFQNDEIHFIISEALEIKEDVTFKFSCHSSIQTYFNSLVEHRFLYFDSKEQRFSLTKPGRILGNSLLELRNPEFLHYDEKYMVKLITNILVILRKWSKAFDEKKKQFYQDFDEDEFDKGIEFFQILLKNEQELMCFQEITIQVIDLSESTIQIFEDLKQITSKFQEDYIKSVHEKLDINHVKSQINIHIIEFQKKIEVLNNKNQEIAKLVFKNEQNIEEIYLICEKLEDEFIQMAMIFLDNGLKSESEIFILVNKLSRIVSKIQEFTSQFDRTIFDVTTKRIDSIQNLFQYLRQLIYNTQFLGDLYNIWRKGIYNIINDQSVLPKFCKINQSQVISPVIETISFGDYCLELFDRDTLKKLDDAIKKRNIWVKQYNFIQIEKAAKNRIENQKFEELIISIIEQIINTNDFVNLNEVIFNSSKNTIFDFSHFYPAISTKFWEEASKLKKFDIIIKELQGELIYVTSNFNYDENKIVRVKSPYIKFKKRKKRQ